MPNPLPGLLFASWEGETKEINDLIGKKFSCINSSEDLVLAACSDGLYGINSEVHCLQHSGFELIASGKNFFVATDCNKSIYSWGDSGFNGQLGQGACRQSLLEPSVINHSSKFVEISCGEAFSLALDDIGNAYSWGENFDRQLGLYTKDKSAMLKSNNNESRADSMIMIQDLSFVPRLIPLGKPVLKIACGLRFALAIAQGGLLYSWGAGECGQLGTGRCTRREVPAVVMLQSNTDKDNDVVQTTPLLVQDVACGNGHVVAVSIQNDDDNISNASSNSLLVRGGRLYCWGLNKNAQLGLGTGDSTSRHYPQLVMSVLNSVPIDNQGRYLPYYTGNKDIATDINTKFISNIGGSNNNSKDDDINKNINVAANIVFHKVYAQGYSSAALDETGRLYTWGRCAYDRLMHKLPLPPPLPDLTAISRTVDTVSLAKTVAAATPNGGSSGGVVSNNNINNNSCINTNAIASLGRPTLVRTAHLTENSRIESFAFSRQQSVALVLTTLSRVSPQEGPKRSFSQMQLYGDGFWDSPQIIVKFTFKQATVQNGGSGGGSNSSYNGSVKSASLANNGIAPVPPPRSCSGKYLRPNLLVCKPPKFQEVGVYTVSVSMDGVSFLEQTVSVLVHQELVVQKLLPSLIDLNSVTNNTIPQLELIVAGLPAMLLPSNGASNSNKSTNNAVLPVKIGNSSSNANNRQYSVKLLFYNIEGLPSNNTNNTRSSFANNSSVNNKTTTAIAAAAAADIEIETVATLMPVSLQQSNEYGSNSSGNDGVEQVRALVCRNVDITALIKYKNSVSFATNIATNMAGKGLFEMRCTVSINGQDFSSVKPKRMPVTVANAAASAVQSSRNGGGGVVASNNDTTGAGAGSVDDSRHDNNSAISSSILVYTFNATSVHPGSLAIDRLVVVTNNSSSASSSSGVGNTAAVSFQVNGKSFLPTARLPKGAQIMVTLSAAQSVKDIVWSNATIANGGGNIMTTASTVIANTLSALPPLVLAVRCDSTNILSFTLTAAAKKRLRKMISVLNDLAARLRASMENGGNTDNNNDVSFNNTHNVVENDDDYDDDDENEQQQLLIASPSSAVDVLPLRLSFALQLPGVRLAVPLHNTSDNAVASTSQSLVIRLFKNHRLQIVPNCAPLYLQQQLPQSADTASTTTTGGINTTAVAATSGMPAVSSTSSSLSTFCLLVNRSTIVASSSASNIASNGSSSNNISAATTSVTEATTVDVGTADGFDFASAEDIAVAVHIPILPTTSSMDAADSIQMHLQQQLQSIQPQQFHAPIMIPKNDISVVALPSNNNETSTISDSMPSSLKYAVQLKLHPFSYYLQRINVLPIANNNNNNNSGSSSTLSDQEITILERYQYLYVSTWLDGISQPSQDTWTKLYLYRNLAQRYTLSPTIVPKGGFTAGSLITLNLSSYCPPVPRIASYITDTVAAASGSADNALSMLPEQCVVQPQQCVVRIRGGPTAIAPDGAVILVHIATVSEVLPTPTPSVAAAVATTVSPRSVPSAPPAATTTKAAAAAGAGKTPAANATPTVKATVAAPVVPVAAFVAPVDPNSNITAVSASSAPAAPTTAIVFSIPDGLKSVPGMAPAIPQAAATTAAAAVVSKGSAAAAPSTGKPEKDSKASKSGGGGAAGAGPPGYYVDISMDGGVTFDKSDAPLLQLNEKK